MQVSDLLDAKQQKERDATAALELRLITAESVVPWFALTQTHQPESRPVELRDIVLRRAMEPDDPSPEPPLHTRSPDEVVIDDPVGPLLAGGPSVV
jgi:hypothetical protein